MKILEYTVRFTTPAFLGNAEQSGQWRTPPFKALLRQWWRMAYAAERGFRVEVPEMRREEGLLFGHAWLDDDRDNCGRKVAARRSLVRIRLSRWNEGELRSWQGLEQRPVFHPETEKTHFKVGPHAYLGYGPLDGRGNTQFSQKRNAAVQAGESATLSIAAPAQHMTSIQSALCLIDRFGTLGGRSRNGWGSVSLTPLDGTPTLTADARLRPWREALVVDWPHAICSDENGALVWSVKEPLTDWKLIMRELAIIKIGLRTQFVFPNGRPPHPNVEPRHWLSYPITRHTTRAWDRGARLPNSLRFKIRPAPNDSGKLAGVIFHVPCLPPPEFNPDRNAVVRTWQRVHALLDELTKPVASRSYGSIDDASRRAQLKMQLDSVRLTRIAE